MSSTADAGFLTLSTRKVVQFRRIYPLIQDVGAALEGPIASHQGQPSVGGPRRGRHRCFSENAYLKEGKSNPHPGRAM